MTEADIMLVIARIAIGSLFVVSAIDKFRLDPMEMEQVASLHLPVPAVLMRLTGAFELAGALALGLGLYSRIAAIGLALFLAFVSLAFLQFWSVKNPAQIRAMMRNAFMGNIAVIGGLLYISVCGAGALAICDLNLGPQ